MYPRMINGKLEVTQLKNGGRRVLIVSKNGEQIGIDISPERAAEIARDLTVTPQPAASEKAA